MLEDIAKVRLPVPEVYQGADNSSTYLLKDGIRAYLDVISGRYGEMYKYFRDSQVGVYLYRGKCSEDQVRWGDNPEVDQANGMFGKLSGIEWGYLADPAVRLHGVATVAKKDLNTEIMSVAGKIAAAWPDQSGAFAAAKLKQLADACSKYGDSTDALAAAIGAPRAGLHDGTRDKVLALVNFCVNDQNAQGFIKFMRDQNIDELVDRMEALLTRLQLGVTYGTGIGTEQPFNLNNMQESGKVISSPSFGAKWYSDQEIIRLKTFADLYCQSVVAFRQLIRETYDAINQQMGNLVELIPDDSSPFDALKSDPAKPEPKSSGTASSGGGGGGGGGGGYSGGGGYGGGTAAAGYVPPSSSAYTPTVPATPDLPAASDLTSASSVAPVAEPETVTIKDGDRQIAVQSPDGQGHVKISIDGGNGKPKTYDMDFGDSPSQSRGGASDVRQNGTDERADSAKAGGNPAGDDSEHAKAGPDGKVVMHDGDLTITAERPDGMPDQLKVTVDDGSGHPTTYNIDYQDGSTDPTQPGADPAHPDGTATPAAHDGAGGTGHGGSAGTGGTAHPGHSAAATNMDADQSAHTGAGTANLAADTTTPQGSADPLTTGGPPGSASHPAEPGHHTGAQDQDVVHPAGPGDAQLAAGPDAPAQNTGAAQQSGMAGMPMMGGGMGGGGGGGGDSQRNGGGSWRATGNLFEDESSAVGVPEGANDDFDEELQW